MVKLIKTIMNKKYLYLIIIITLIAVVGTMQFKVIYFDSPRDFHLLEIKPNESIHFELDDFNTKRNRPNIELDHLPFLPFTEFSYEGFFEANCPPDNIVTTGTGPYTLTSVGPGHMQGYYIYIVKGKTKLNKNSNLDYYPLPSACKYPGSPYTGLNIHAARGLFKIDRGSDSGVDLSIGRIPVENTLTSKIKDILTSFWYWIVDIYYSLFG